MPIHDDVVVSAGHKYKVLRIAQEHLPELQNLLRSQLSNICYGPERVNIEPDEYTYRAACRQLHANLDRYDEVKKYGLVGELLMHILAPQLLGFNAESMSTLLALQNQNVKPGFDLNFHDKDEKKIWYGEVKSGLNLEDRKVLIARARDGLRNYFNNIGSTGEKSTHYRWEAAKSEVAVMFASEDRVTLTQLLTSDRSSIQRNDGKRRNAILMTVNFGDDSYDIDGDQDINDSITSLERMGCFDDYLVISSHKRTFDDIIDFLKNEGELDG